MLCGELKSLADACDVCVYWCNWHAIRKQQDARSSFGTDPRDLCQPFDGILRVHRCKKINVVWRIELSNYIECS
jgi:hypothetical protein